MFVHATPGLQQNVVSDFLKLSQATGNFVSNAIKFARANVAIRIAIMHSNCTETMMAAEDCASAEAGSLMHVPAVALEEAGNGHRRKHLRHQHWLFVQVADDGKGMSTQQMGRLFHPFYQVEHGGSVRMAGTGLGLSISKRIVAAWGGRVFVRSMPDVGSTFSFTIPFEPVDAEEPDAVSASALDWEKMLWGEHLFSQFERSSQDTLLSSR